MTEVQICSLFLEIIILCVYSLISMSIDKKYTKMNEKISELNEKLDKLLMKENGHD